MSKLAKPEPRGVAAESSKGTGHLPQSVLSLAFALVAVAVITIMGFTAHTTAIFSYDLPIMQAVQGFNPPWFDGLMRSVNWMGFGLQSVSIISGIIVVMFLVGWRWEAVVGAVDAATVWAVNVLIGQIVNRPYVTQDQYHQVFLDLTHPSFPAGHITSYWAFYGFMCYLVYTRVRNPIIRFPLTVLFGGLVLAVVPSRMYMGRHWPSDVFASLFLGALWLAGTIAVYRWGLHKTWIRTHFIDRHKRDMQLASVEVGH